jgi:hypothetical protein
MQKIQFAKIINLPQIAIPTSNIEIALPVPASKVIPEWYKKSEPYLAGEKKPIGDGNRAPATLKRCMPFFDAMTSGYIIPSMCDVYVNQVDGQPNFEWTAYSQVEFHPIEQAPYHPDNKHHQVAIPKWNSPWSIKTPKGYSCLFVTPFNHDLPFTIFSGVVDTDTYQVPVAFPFVLKEPNFEGMIPAGTPIAQVIPFKRESWKMEISGKELVDLAQQQSTKIMTKFFDAYKNLFRQTKEYR